MQKAWRQGLEAVGIDQDPGWLLEGADDVLDAAEIHAGLPSDRRVQLGEQGRRQVVEIDAPHIAGGRESGQVPDHAAALGDHRVAAREAADEHFRQEGLPVVQALACLALGEDETIPFPACVQDRFRIGGRHAVIRHDQDLPVQVQQGACAGQDAASDDDLVRPLGGLAGQVHFPMRL